MGLSAAQMARMSALLDQALDLDEARRRQWLERLGPEHRDLEGALRQALLPQESDRAGSDRLATLPKVDAPGGRASTLKPGERVGPYQLERTLGSGGMAEVWLAQRADGAFKREVALKLPMLSRLRQDLASRFARERDILAGLEHPNIARLYDAGVTPEGLPYLAMEYVHGEPMTAWCDAHRLGVRERLKLFLQVLDAVQYAHGHHVIHRDIKPSNILVSDSGQVRLLDFGVAKLLADEEERTELTQLYGKALTPEYASPELIRGDPIDAASDVYCLGVVLYELLSGSRPYRIKAGESLAALEQAVAGAQVERPSTQLGQDADADRSTTQDRLARLLRGDLDAIVLKALAKRPEDRYGSAAALADDLQRYLAGEPVKARPTHLSYRVSKFVLRHPIAVPVVTASVLLFAAMGWGLMRRELSIGPPAPSASSIPTQEIVTQSAAPAAATDRSIAVLPFVDMSENKDQEYFSDGLSEEVIDRLTHAADLRVISRTSSFYFKGKQATIGDIAKTLGVSHVLEGSVRKAGRQLRITAQLIRASDGSHLWSQTYDRSLADIFKVQDEIAGTVAQALEVALRSGTTGRSEASQEAYSLVLKGNYFINRGTREDSDKALQLYMEATRLDPNYALAWAKLGRWTHKNSREGLAKALEALQRSLRIDPKLAYAHYVLGRTHMYFEWDWPAAKSELEHAIELDPDDLHARVELAYLTEGIFGQFDRKLRYLRQIVSSDPLDPDSLEHLAYSLFLAGRFDEAAAPFRKLVQLNPAREGAQAEYGVTLLLLHQPRDALAAIEKETDEASRLWGLAILDWEIGRKAESDAAVSRLEEKYASTVYVSYIAEVRAYRGEVDAAFKWLDRAYQRNKLFMTLMPVDPLLRNLHGDSRFDAMLAKVKLDDWKRKVFPNGA